MTPKQLCAYIKKNLKKMVVSHNADKGEAIINVNRTEIIDVLKFLQNDSECRFTQLSDITAVDWPSRFPDRFDVVYHLLSMRLNQRIRVKVSTDDATPVASITDIFPSAIWAEREVYDMYGVLFEGNPDLRRILTDYGFEGHPLRKDFPLTGFVEVRYDSEKQAVVYDDVKLQQDFRNFDFESPWEAMETVQESGDKKNMTQKIGTIDYRNRASDMMKAIGK